MAKNHETRITGNARDLLDILPPLNPKFNKHSFGLYSSPDALADHAANTDQKSCWQQSAWTNGRSFTGSESMQEAIELCRNGWPQGAARVAKLRDRINAAHPTAKRMARYDVAGAFPSVPRALAGNPMHMRRLDMADTRKRPVMTLLCDMSSSAMINSKSITNRAAVVAAIIDSIESAGYAAHVICFFSTANDDVQHITAFTVKESDQSADIGKLAYGLGHASMFRRLSWVPAVENTFTSGLQSYLGFPHEARLKATERPNTFIIPAVDETNESYFKTEESAATRGLDYLLGELRKQACPAFPTQEAA